MIYRASEWRVLSLRFRASRLDSFRGQFFWGRKVQDQGASSCLGTCRAQHDRSSRMMQ